MLNRKIHPIGQGCCIEQLMTLNGETKRLLYDCGSFDLAVIKNCIEKMDPAIPTTLVVSHLHRDHINGIPHLVDHFKAKRTQIKQLYLPYYHHDMVNLFAASIVATFDENDQDASRLIDFIVNQRRSEGFERSTYVFPRGVGPVPVEDEKEIIADSNLHSLQTLDCDVSWLMKFWVDSDIYSLLTPNEVVGKMDIEKLKSFTVENFKDPAKKKEIIGVYYKIVKNRPADFNKTSMLMASFVHCCCNRLNFKDISPGFVCTGDYPFNNEKTARSIQNHYASEQILLHEMMVPHHGSDKYCEYMPFDFIKKAYAQNGEKTRYRHPGHNTEQNLKNWGIDFCNVPLQDDYLFE